MGSIRDQSQHRSAGAPARPLRAWRSRAAPFSVMDEQLMSGHTESALGRLALVSLFALAPRLFVEVEMAYPANTLVAPPTYFAITHKRDSDAMAPVPSLLRHR